MKIKTHTTQHYDLMDLTRGELTTILDALSEYFGNHRHDTMAEGLANNFYAVLWPENLPED